MRISDWSSDVCSSDLNIGAIVRAGIENREMVSVIGINIEKVFTLTFGLGAWLAGIAGGLAAPIMGVTPAMGFDILPIAFVIVVVAGLGSIPGAIVAGILIGIAQSLTTIVFPAASQRSEEHTSELQSLMRISYA